MRTHESNDGNLRFVHDGIPPRPPVDGEWTRTTCKNPACRTPDSLITVRKGEEAHAECNECFSR